jgi:hypothetical protein
VSDLLRVDLQLTTSERGSLPFTCQQHRHRQRSFPLAWPLRSVAKRIRPMRCLPSNLATRPIVYRAMSLEGGLVGIGIGRG